MGVVKNSWQMPIEGQPIEVLHKKLKRLKQVLKEFNSSKFAGISKKVKEKRKEMENIQLSIFSNGPNAGLLDQEKDISKELHELMLMEESIYRQKLRVQWL